MARSSNALWIGAIVIVAALTAVELLSSRDSNDDTTESIDSTATIADTLSPASQIATGAITEARNDDKEFATVVDPDKDFDPSAFQAPNLVVDLDNLENDIALIEDDVQALEDIAELAKQQASATDTENDTLTADLQTATISEIAASERDGILTNADLNDESETDLTTIIADTTNEISEASTEDKNESEQIPQAPGISHHLAEAEQAIKELRLTTPEGNNAYEHYQAVLALDTNHSAAQAGLQKIVDMYIYFVEKAITDDKLPTAKVYLQRAESLQPESAKLKALRAELE